MQRGFTLIELMIVIAIVGILSSLAISAYNDYVIRAKSTELITVAASYKSDITEYYAVMGTMPTRDEIQYPTSLIRRIEFWRARDDRMVIHIYPTTLFWDGLDENVDAVLLEGIAQANGSITWACGPHSAFRYIPTKYLPSSCRAWIDDQR